MVGAVRAADAGWGVLGPTELRPQEAWLLDVSGRVWWQLQARRPRTGGASVTWADGAISIWHFFFNFLF